MKFVPITEKPLWVWNKKNCCKPPPVSFFLLFPTKMMMMMMMWVLSFVLAALLLNVRPLIICFFRGEIANVVWKHFSRVAGINIGSSLKHSIRRWWEFDGNARERAVYNVVPIIIIWFIWKRRNTVLHGGSYSTGKMIWEIIETIKKFMKLRFRESEDRNSWPDIVLGLERYRPKLKIRIVRWFPPPAEWVKCNTDVASRGNPGPSSIAFCIRTQMVI